MDLNECCLDIFFFNETLLTQRVSDLEITLDGYNIFCIDTKSKGGAVLIYVKDFLSACYVAAVTLPKSFEYIVLDICPGVSDHFTVIGIYRPPSTNCEALEDAKLISSHVKSELVILNLDWLSKNSARLQELC